MFIALNTSKENRVSGLQHGAREGKKISHNHEQMWPNNVSTQDTEGPACCCSLWQEFSSAQSLRHQWRHFVGQRHLPVPLFMEVQCPGVFSYKGQKKLFLKMPGCSFLCQRQPNIKLWFCDRPFSMLCSFPFFTSNINDKWWLHCEDPPHCIHIYRLQQPRRCMWRHCEIW